MAMGVFREKERGGGGNSGEKIESIRTAKERFMCGQKGRGKRD